jgi:hypothetical protein
MFNMPLRHALRDASRYTRHTLLGLPKRTYWQSRENARYLRAVRALVNRSIAEDRVESILDVGSNGCGYLEWFPDVPCRVSLDIDNPYASDRVEAIKADFFAYEATRRFDLVLCLQVLEHIPQAAQFARRLLAATGRQLVVSVPYKWPRGRCEWHVHDPVDEDKMLSWFGREPDYQTIVREKIWYGKARLVCCYARGH